MLFILFLALLHRRAPVEEWHSPSFANPWPTEVLPPGIFLWYESLMRSIQAPILLFALLAGMGSALAQATRGHTMTCCANDTCPVHGGRNSHNEKPHSAGTPGSTCECSSSNESHKLILPALSEAVLEFAPVPFVPWDSRFAATPISMFVSRGFVPFPEQPPRL
jgi:hypothetical protein